eukprot:768001-Hanusia_phi.AAC.4
MTAPHISSRYDRDVLTTPSKRWGGLGLSYGWKCIILLHKGNVGSEVEQSDQVEGRGCSEPAAYGWETCES